MEELNTAGYSSDESDGEDYSPMNSPDLQIEYSGSDEVSEGDEIPPVDLQIVTSSNKRAIPVDTSISKSSHRRDVQIRDRICIHIGIP